ncbi:MAG: hypothetical protein CL477_08090 [Acidobacteria bacterium]|jgi:hypothetical protein|nr:hypothetical protein [Acidobacteriota bacterium]MDP7693513.1 hypothetical protein [Vicinamibacterales bacterium]HJN44317.1 hypothetical protein [Vicinamibacterales bacterium]|tara:strand:- start:669 stop:902 length:234 start_codon:yes stop_codon:yes gene_type:complete
MSDTIEIHSDFWGVQACPDCEAGVQRVEWIDGSMISLDTPSPRILTSRPCPEGCKHSILTIPAGELHRCAEQQWRAA